MNHPEPLEPREQQPGDFFATAVLFEMGLGVVAMLLGWWTECSPLATIREDASWPATLSATGWGMLATLPMLAGLWLIERLDLPALRELQDYVRDRLLPLLADCRIWQLAVVAVLAGVGEEMLFRGWMQSSLEQWVGGTAATTLSLVTVSVIFGICHAVTSAYFVLATLIGVYLGWLYIATGNLMAPILAHALYDFCALIYLTRFRSEQGEQTETRNHRDAEDTEGMENIENEDALRK